MLASGQGQISGRSLLRLIQAGIVDIWRFVMGKLWREQVDKLEAELAEALADNSILDQRLSDVELEAESLKAELNLMIRDRTYIAAA